MREFVWSFIAAGFLAVFVRFVYYMAELAGADIERSRAEGRRLERWLAEGNRAADFPPSQQQPADDVSLPGALMATLILSFTFASLRSCGAV